ncbi:MAG: hypothetical protein PVG07_00750 [Acidobacteriota bacterium]|jgi:hypothetical protein
MAGSAGRKERGWLAGLRRLSSRVATAQSLLVLTVIYCTVVPVLSLIRLRDPLSLKTDGDDSFWRERSTGTPAVESLRRLF